MDLFLLPELRVHMVTLMAEDWECVRYALVCREALTEVARAERLPSLRLPAQWLHVLCYNSPPYDKMAAFVRWLVARDVTRGRLSWYSPGNGAKPCPSLFIHYNATRNWRFEWAPDGIHLTNFWYNPFNGRWHHFDILVYDLVENWLNVPISGLDCEHCLDAY
jgi:hypothetical protein